MTHAELVATIRKADAALLADLRRMPGMSRSEVRVLRVLLRHARVATRVPSALIIAGLARRGCLALMAKAVEDVVDDTRFSVPERARFVGVLDRFEREVAAVPDLRVLGALVAEASR